MINKIDDKYSKNKNQSIQVLEISFAIINQGNSSWPLRKVFSLEIRLYMLFVDLSDILRSYIEKSICMVLQASLDQSIMTLTNMSQVYSIFIPQTKLTNLPKCNSSNGVSPNISDRILSYPLTHLHHRIFLLIIYMSFLTDFKHNMFRLYDRNKRNVVSQNSVHLFIHISPLFETDVHLIDDVVLLEVIFFFKTNSLQTIGRQESNCENVFVFVSLVLSLLFFVSRICFYFKTLVRDFIAEIIHSFLFLKCFQDACQHCQCLATNVLANFQGIATIKDKLLASKKIALKISTMNLLVIP